MIYSEFDSQWRVWRKPITISDGKDENAGANPESYAAGLGSTPSTLNPSYLMKPIVQFSRLVDAVETASLVVSTKRLTSSTLTKFTSYRPTNRDKITLRTTTGVAWTTTIADKASALAVTLTDVPAELSGTITNVEWHLTPENRIIQVPQHSAILLRAFGKDTAADTCTLTILGYAHTAETRDGIAGPGKGFVVWNGQLALGANQINEAPWTDASFADATWFEVETWNDAVAGGANPFGAQVLTSQNCGLLLLPTVAFPLLLAELTDLGGGGTEMTEIGLLYKRVSLGGVI